LETGCFSFVVVHAEDLEVRQLEQEYTVGREPPFREGLSMVAEE
jgi:hypothetical protein